MKCWEIKDKLYNSLSSLFTCEDKGDFLSIKTPFSYPDGDDIDLFILPSNSHIVITDMGETLRYLGTYDFEIRTSRSRTEIFEDVLKSFGVSYLKGHLFINLRSPDEISEAMLRMAQAITRVCDLLYTIRPKSTAAFKEEVRELLER